MIQLNLNEEMSAHFNRVKSLAEEAEHDEEERYASRAAAMTALSNILGQLTKTHESIINMERLMHVEKETIATVEEFLTPEQHEAFLKRLEERLSGQGN